MRKLRLLACVPMLALSQLLLASFAAAQFGSGLPQNGFSQGSVDAPDWADGAGSSGVDTCRPPPASVPPLPIKPLDHDATVAITVTVRKDGSILSVGLMGHSDDAARDAALVAHVKKNWNLATCRPGNFIFRVHYLHITCAPQPLPQTQTPPDVDLQDRPRSTDLSVGVDVDGTVQFAAVARSSGDAALDAAAVAHVKQAWRWQPLVCPAAKSPLTMGTATVSFPYMVPDLPAP